MFYNEHNPPHFHVAYQEYKALITIEDGIMNGSLPRRALSLVYEWLDLHKKELMENWERMKSNQGIEKIEPLK